MDVAPEELPAVAAASHAVIDQAKAAGVFVFGGGLSEEVAPVLVDGNRGVATGTYPETAQLDGGFTIIDVPSREEAVEWAAKIAISCRCPQELREFQYDPLV